MKREWISEALNRLDEDLIAETLTYRGKNRREIPKKNMEMENYDNNKSRRLIEKLAVLALAACLILALTVTAYAANLWGMRELFHTDFRDLSDEAASLIEAHEESGEGKDWNARILESLYDGSSVMLTVTISCRDSYILAPTDAMPEDPLWVIGREGEETLAGYAEEQGKSLMMVNASLPFSEERFGNQSMRHENVSDGEMAILIRADVNTPGDNLNTVCTVTARIYDVVSRTWGELQRLEIPFTLNKNGVSETHLFKPVDPDAVACMHVGDAVITETALGLTIDIPMTITDKADFENFMKMDFDGIVTFEGSIGENGAHFAMCRESLPIL